MHLSACTAIWTRIRRKISPRSDYLEEHDKDGQGLTTQVKSIRRAIEDPDNNWSQLLCSLWTDIDAHQRRKLVENAIVNGTLIDDEFADEMLRIGNFIPAISIEGFEEATDFRRGKGTYRKGIEAMERHALGGKNYAAKCFVCHSNCPETAEETVQALKENFPHISIWMQSPDSNDATADRRDSLFLSYNIDKPNTSSVVLGAS